MPGRRRGLNFARLTRNLRRLIVAQNRLGGQTKKYNMVHQKYYVCGDLFSGSPALILGVSPAQALFVDRIVIPSIVASAVTVWGEELLAQIPLPPIRRFDVFKAFFGLFCQVLTSAAPFPLLPDPAKYVLAVWLPCTLTCAARSAKK